MSIIYILKPTRCDYYPVKNVS